MRSIASVMSLYFRISSASLSITFLSPEAAASINTHVPFSLRILIAVYLFFIVVYVFFIVVYVFLLLSTYS